MKKHTFEKNNFSFTVAIGAYDHDDEESHAHWSVTLAIKVEILSRVNFEWYVFGKHFCCVLFCRSDQIRSRRWSKMNSRQNLRHQMQWLNKAEIFSTSFQYEANTPQTSAAIPNWKVILASVTLVYAMVFHGWATNRLLWKWVGVLMLELCSHLLLFMSRNWIVIVCKSKMAIQSLFDCGSKTIWVERKTWLRGMRFRFMWLFHEAKFNWKFLSWKLFNQNFPLDE